MKIVIEFDEKESQKKAIDFLSSSEMIEELKVEIKSQAHDFLEYLRMQSMLLKSHESERYITEILNKFKGDFIDYL